MQIVALIIMAIALAIAVAMIADKDTYKTFEEAKNLPEGKLSTVVGQLTNLDQIYFDPAVDPNLTIFYVKDEDGNIMKVRYNEPKPRDFERSEQITVTGKVVGDEYYAEKILVKCPSKYVDEGVEEATAKVQ